MRLYGSLILSVFCLVISLPGPILAGNLPRGNLVLSPKVNIERAGATLDKLVLGLERELRQRGYDGKITRTDHIPCTIGTDDNLITLTLLKSHWITKKSLSVPYLLNRYRSEYLLELELGLMSTSREIVCEKIRAGQNSPTQAQLFSNDEYDPDLFLDQGQRLLLEEKAYADVIKSLADRLGARLK